MGHGRLGWQEEGDSPMKNQVEAAIRAVQAVKNEITQIRNKLPEGDRRLETVDDAELGAEWIAKRLEQLKQSATSN